MANIGKTGILLVNLGTPDSPSVPDVRKYLREFLMDERVIDIPVLSRWFLINLIIAPFRSPKSAKIYKQLWTNEGSPLKIYGESNEKQLLEALGDNYVVKLAMRYQSPSIEEALLSFQKMALSKIVVIPLFPQYASASTGSVHEKVMDLVKKWQIIPEIRYVNNFYDEPLFIQGFAENARKMMQAQKYDFVVFSYHGLPERQMIKGDTSGNTCQFGSCCDKIQPMNQHCYRAQCFATTRLLVKELNLKEGTYLTSFQSRLGKTPWIKPYSDEIAKSLAEQGIKKVLAFSPAFVADCLETTIEVAEEYREIFEKSGGQIWHLVPSLNDSPTWIDLLKKISVA